MLTSDHEGRIINPIIQKKKEEVAIRCIINRDEGRIINNLKTKIVTTGNT